jgi:tRNA dimethylallyltransferase
VPADKSISMLSGRTPKDCWFLTGPTASGKTAVGVALAKRLGAEIISLDSMAVYRGMDIGTAKPSVAEREGVPHHLIDVISPREEFSVAAYVELAEQAVVEISGRGHEVLFVGGTPLYLKALLRGLDAGPPASESLREELIEWAVNAGPRALHDRVKQVDPAAAARLHPNDTRRLIRALEVYEATGQTISSRQQHFSVGRPAEECRVFVLEWPRAELYERINQRVEAMFAAGLVDEVTRLLEAGEGDRRDAFGSTASQAVGYHQALELILGSMSLPEAIQQTQTQTRQFAKRQLTWFRSLSECRFVPVEGTLDPEVVAERIFRMGAPLR